MASMVECPQAEREPVLHSQKLSSPIDCHLRIIYICAIFFLEIGPGALNSMGQLGFLNMQWLQEGSTWFRTGNVFLSRS